MGPFAQSDGHDPPRLIDGLVPSLATVFLMSSAPEAAIRDKCLGYALFIREPFEIYGVIDLVTRALKPHETAELRT
jgi:hypothetical protein